MAAHRESIADQIARQLGGNWHAVRNGFGWRYESDDGREVRRYAYPVADWTGYSDSEFTTVYEETGTGKRVYVA